MRFLSVCSGIEAASVAWGPMGMRAVAFAEVEAFPSAVLAHRFPHVPNLGDMTKIDGKAFRGVDIVVGGTPCFVAGTLITTSRGIVPIETVEVGDIVLTHRLRWRSVLRTGSTVSRTVIVKGQGHPGLVTTHEHPFYARKKGGRSTRISGQSVRLTWIEDPQWVEAKDLAGHHWASVAQFPAMDIPPITTEGNEREAPQINEHLMWLAGAYLGDGWTQMNSRRGGVIYGVNPSKAESIKAHCAALGMSFTETQGRTGPRIHIHGRAFARWLDANFGKYSDAKRIPVWALGMDAALRRALLDGYDAMDGTRSESCRGRRIATICRDLAFGTRMLANSLGHASSVSHIVPKRSECVIEGRVVNERPYYTVTISNSDRSSFEADGMRFGRVRSVAETGKEEVVWNLEVEDDNSYVADGYVVHNCQAFSVAGLRRGLEDARGNLTLKYVELCNEANPDYIVWENVPGVLSSKDNAFGCFISGLAGGDAPAEPGPRPAAGKNGKFWRWDKKLGTHVPKWSSAGHVVGPKRIVAWRCLDAQFFGLAQRRLRVFVVACPRNGADPREILFEREGVRWNPPPRREAGEGVARSAQGSSGGAGGDGPVNGRAGGRGGVTEFLPQSSRVYLPDGVAPAIQAIHQRGGNHAPQVLAFGGNNTAGPIDVATAVNAHGGPHGRLDFESETFVAQPVAYRVHAAYSTAMTGNGNARSADPVDVARCLDSSGGFATNQGGNIVMQPASFALRGISEYAPGLPLLRAKGGDCAGGSEAPIAQPTAYRTSGNCGAWETGDRVDALTTGTDPNSHLIAFQCQGINVSVDGDITGTVRKGNGHLTGGNPCVAFSCKDYGADAGELSPTLRAMGHGGSHANAGGQVAVCVTGDIAHTLNTANNGKGCSEDGNGRGVPTISIGHVVRRLIPTECERLQGFPDGHTDIIYRGKPAADGPRYKAIGNSMATQVMRWIGLRIVASYWRQKSVARRARSDAA